MEVILGIDTGSSATKIVGLRPDGSVISAMRVKASEPAASVFGAFGSYLKHNDLSLSDVREIVLTGIGAAYLDGDIYGIPVRRVDEFHSISKGALTLTGRTSGLIASMGTGTAFLWAKEDGTVEHLCGTGVGGGTLSGLCQAMVGIGQAESIGRFAARGNLSQVDLTIGDLTPSPEKTLDPSLTASNFGKLSEEASREDLAAGAVNLVLQTIGTMTVLACRCCHVREVILTGSLTLLPQSSDNFSVFERVYGIHYIVPDHPAYATAIGAALHALSDR